MSSRNVLLALSAALAAACCLQAPAQTINAPAVDRWVTVEAAAAGTDLNAKDEAVKQALRKAVEQACGVFLNAQSKTGNYKLVYDKVFAGAVGYVREHEVLRSWLQDGNTHVRIRARVSTQKFEKDWITIAHTVHQEGDPRVIIVVSETSYAMLDTHRTTEMQSGSGTVDITGRVDTDERTGARVDRTSGVVVVDDRGRGAAGAAGSTEQGTARRTGSTTIDVHGTATTQSARTLTESELKIFTVKECGAVQSKLEDFFLSKGIKLVDRATAGKVADRDLRLAAAANDPAKIAAIAARFNADVVILGSAGAKYGQEIRIGEVTMHQTNAQMVVRAIRTDTGQLLAVKAYGPITSNSLQKGGGEDKALAKLADESAPKLLSAVVEAWRKQVNVARDLTLHVAGMDYKTYKLFKEEMEKVRGVESVQLKEITESVAAIDIKYAYSNENLADRLRQLKKVKLEVTEFSANRLKLKVVK